MLKCKEGSSNGFKSIWLNNWPFLNKFGILALIQKHSNITFLFNHLIKKGNLQSIQNIFIVILAFSWTIDRTIWNSINQVLKDCFGLWRYKNIAPLNLNKNDHFWICFMKVFIGVDRFTWKTNKEPIEQICWKGTVSWMWPIDEK